MTNGWLLKTVAALIATALVALQTGLADGGLSVQDWIITGSTVLGALGVAIVPNTPELGVAKLVVAAMTAGFVAAQTAISDGSITGSEWITILIAALGALGVWAAPGAASLFANRRGGTVRP
jgi:hypothetical protein